MMLVNVWICLMKTISFWGEGSRPTSQKGFNNRTGGELIKHWQNCQTGILNFMFRSEWASSGRKTKKKKKMMPTMTIPLQCIHSWRGRLLSYQSSTLIATKHTHLKRNWLLVAIKMSNNCSSDFECLSKWSRRHSLGRWRKQTISEETARRPPAFVDEVREYESMGLAGKIGWETVECAGEKRALEKGFNTF